MNVHTFHKIAAAAGEVGFVDKRDDGTNAKWAELSLLPAEEQLKTVIIPHVSFS